MQYAVHKDFIWLGGFAFIYMNADHMIIKRTEQRLRSLGLIHDNVTYVKVEKIPMF